jgi:hypothetical protein
MKTLILSLAVMASLALKPASPTQNPEVFKRAEGKNVLILLKLYPNKTYCYTRYNRTRISRDTGTYYFSKHKLKMKSCLKRHGTNPILNEKVYVNNKGLYNSHWDFITSKKIWMEKVDFKEYSYSWTFNPILKKQFIASGEFSASEVLAETKHIPAANEAKVPAPNAGEIVKNFYIRMAETWSPGYGDVLRKNYCGPDCFYSMVDGVAQPWSGDTVEVNLRNQYETVIHESVHHVNSYSNYLIVPGIEINVSRGKYFKSAEFATIVPEGLNENIFRYKTYVDSTSYVGANVSGIYGLMDEFSAYLNGVRACQVGAKTALIRKDTTMALLLRSQATGTYFAWYEFRLFTAWYLHYASLKHPEIYTDLQANTNLRIVFTLLDDEFRKTIQGMNDLNIRNHSWSDAIEYYESKYVSECKTALVTEEVWLKKFRYDSVNQGNYLKYLK